MQAVKITNDLLGTGDSFAEGMLSDTGALVIRTGEFIGRSPRDRFIVKDEITTATVDWNSYARDLPRFTVSAPESG